MRKTLKSQVNKLVELIEKSHQEFPQISFILDCIDNACVQETAPRYVSEYLKHSIIVRHFWAHMFKDLSRVLDLAYEIQLPTVVKRNLEMISLTLAHESTPHSSEMNHLFGREAGVDIFNVSSKFDLRFGTRMFDDNVNKQKASCPKHIVQKTLFLKTLRLKS